MNITAEIHMIICKRRRWSSRNANEKPDVLDRLLTLDQKKIPLINVKSLTGLSHALVDPWLRPPLICFHREVSVAASFTWTTFITHVQHHFDALWSVSSALHNEKFPYSYPIIFQTPTHGYTTNSATYLCFVFSYGSSQIPWGHRQSMPSRHAYLSMAAIM